MTVVGIDIGGANLKISDGATSMSRPFPLWKSPDQLADAIQSLLGEYPESSKLAVTMTGELADCFPTRNAGVRHIVESVQIAAGEREVSVWQTGGEFFTPEEAVEFPELVAAANWHALATWAGRAAASGTSSLLIDIGSTTTDFIPIESGVPVPRGMTDLDRLSSGELVYTGVRRTPLFAITPSVEVRGQTTPLAAELFATAHDVSLLLGDCVENLHDLETANSRPLTIPESLNRVARSVCSDSDQLSDREILEIARQVRIAQLISLSTAMASVLGRLQMVPSTIILSGEGEFLAKKMLSECFPDLLEQECFSISQMIGPVHSQTACAYALAILGRERL
ncbi:Hydantoinase/oxoprolinase [Thalassoglobus polymorphus]|uniref:Hydantoinase/oxoprolinase n=1 Tax=Thalassoglobus polymorphus TaxID=2527994 RepID=A0A517QUD6_9PLAN|nr:Hydantoinase/oxoprolinase [Thalassoglobus polymorphus]